MRDLNPTWALFMPTSPEDSAKQSRRGGPMDSRLLMTLQVVVMGAQKIGAAPHGTRVFVPIGSGDFEGPRLRGKVLPGGGDWTLLRETASSSSTCG